MTEEPQCLHDDVCEECEECLDCSDGECKDDCRCERCRERAAEQMADHYND